MTDLPRLPPLTALRTFVVAGRSGSFHDAALRLGVTASAVSHQIRTIENDLGVALFERRPRDTRLTPAGKRLLKVAAKALEMIGRAAEALRQPRRRRLKVSALPFFTQTVLIPLLPRFEAAHPGIDLAIETTNDIADLNAGRADIGIRNLRRPTPGLITQKLLDIRPVPVCAPGLLERVPLKKPADLRRHTLIHVSVRPDSWPRWLANAGVPDLQPRRSLSFDTVPDALDAAARGLGVAIGMAPLIWSAPIAERLVTPLRLTVAGDASYYLVHRKTDRADPAIRAFTTWLISELAPYRTAKPLTRKASAA